MEVFCMQHSAGGREWFSLATLSCATLLPLSRPVSSFSPCRDCWLLTAQTQALSGYCLLPKDAVSPLGTAIQRLVTVGYTVPPLASLGQLCRTTQVLSSWWNQWRPLPQWHHSSASHFAQPNSLPAQQELFPKHLPVILRANLRASGPISCRL